MFVTFRLYGSLPPGRAFPNDRLPSGKAFVVMDHVLDRAEHGTRFLELRDIASMVMNAICDGERRFDRCDLHSSSCRITFICWSRLECFRDPGWVR
jgi:hypothetical protein